MKIVVLALSCVLVSIGTAAEKPAAAAQSKQRAVSEEKEFSGKVAETMNAASYTYILVDTGSKKLWAAAPAFEVKVGDKVLVREPMPMRNYQSKTLKRNFDLVYFTGNVEVNGSSATAAGASAATQLPPNHPPLNNAEMPKNHPPIGAPAREKGEKIAGIKKAQGGKTVSEIFAEKSKLSGKSTSVRGKVVKYNEGIMGRNWIHIQDGTGSVGSNDLLVTTSSAVAVGDTILVTGVVAVNKDFGANYKYPVMIEEAKVVVE